MALKKTPVERWGRSHVTERLKGLRERAGLSMREIAKAMGFAGGSSYQRYEDEDEFALEKYLPLDFVKKLPAALVGRGQPPIELDEVMDLAGVSVSHDGTMTVVDPDALIGIGLDAVSREKLDEATLKRQAPVVNQGPPLFEHDLRQAVPIEGSMQDPQRRDLPVLGSAMGGPEGYFELQGEPIEHVWRPASLATVRNAFALYVVGTSMSPRYEDGELLHCHPARRPKVGDYVVVEMKQESTGAEIMATIGRLRRQTTTYLEIEKLNPPDTIKLAMPKVNRVHVIVGTGQP